MNDDDDDDDKTHSIMHLYSMHEELVILPPPLPLPPPPPPPPPFLSKWYCSFKPLCSVCSFVHVCDCLHFEQIKRCPTKTIVIDLFMYLDTRKTPITFQQATDWATFTDFGADHSSSYRQLKNNKNNSKIIIISQ